VIPAPETSGDAALSTDKRLPRTYRAPGDALFFFQRMRFHFSDSLPSHRRREA
jgi:hypothetical protein